MFGALGIRKSNPLPAQGLGNRNLKLTSDNLSTIVCSQHDYFFIPTTAEQFVI